MSDVPIVPEDRESAAKAAWMAASKSEVEPQVAADPMGVARAVSQAQREREVDFNHGFKQYHAILSAHLPSEASAEEAAAAIQAVGLPEGSSHEIYRAESPYVETPLAQGEVILIVRLGAGDCDQSALEQAIAGAGGSTISYTPPQKLANTGLDEQSD